MDLDDFDGEFLFLGTLGLDDEGFFINAGADNLYFVLEESVDNVLAEESNFGEVGFGVWMHEWDKIYIEMVSR